MDDKTRIELEAAAFRRLVQHLRNRHDVQNIDLMELAGFCRNCLSNWYMEAAAEEAFPSAKKRPERSFTACRTRYGKRSSRHRNRSVSPAEAVG